MLAFALNRKQSSRYIQTSAKLLLKQPEISKKKKEATADIASQVIKSSRPLQRVLQRESAGRKNRVSDAGIQPY